MSKVLYGRVSHYVGTNGVEFCLKKIDKKDVDKEDEAVPYMGDTNIAFEIWQKFKGSKVKITIEKA